MKNIETTLIEKHLDITIRGNFDCHVGEEFRKTYFHLDEEGITCTVDLSEIEYIDSSALGMLLHLKNHISAGDGDITIKNCSPNLRGIFLIARFDKLFNLI